VIKEECRVFLRAKGYTIRNNTAVVGESKLSIQITDKELYTEFMNHLAKNALSS